MGMLFSERKQLFFAADSDYLVLVVNLPNKLEELHVVDGGVVDVWIIFFPIQILG